MTNYSPLKTDPGVLTAPGTEPIFVSALMANEEESEIQYLGIDGVGSIKVARIDRDPNSARLVLITKKIKYTWRPVREADGIWASDFRIPLPVEAIIDIATGDSVETEILSAYSSGDSPYILGVTFETADGQWVRSGGTFLPMVADDTTYADMDRIVIDPSRAKDFLDLYDKNYVTVSDATDYEATSE